MEIKMAQCPNGHYYNAALHASCPECSGKVGPTEPVSGAYQTNRSGASYGETVPVSDNRAGSIDPFEPTHIGPDSVEGKPEPVVGWLVCVEGKSRGVDYRIHAGYNYIGRELGDIHIRGDNQISRQNHAMVAYDSSERVYYVGPSAGRNLIKVNGKAVIGAVEIHSYDIISIGSTKLLFIALCGEHFGWEESENG